MMAAESLLCAILECGACDLEILDRVGYDWKDVLDQIDIDHETVEGIGIEGIMETVFKMAVEEFAQAVDKEWKYLIAKEDRVGLTDAENKKLDLLNSMNQWLDIQMGFNFRDTHAKFALHENAYRKMFPEAIEQFWQNTGLRL